MNAQNVCRCTLSTKINAMLSVHQQPGKIYKHWSVNPALRDAKLALMVTKQIVSVVVRASSCLIISVITSLVQMDGTPTLSQKPVKHVSQTAKPASVPAQEIVLPVSLENILLIISAAQSVQPPSFQVMIPGRV